MGGSRSGRVEDSVRTEFFRSLLISLPGILSSCDLAYSLRDLCLVLTMLLVPAIPTFTQAQVIKSGPPSCPGIALTFDLCPVQKGAGYDQALIDYLIEQKIPATFFMSGRWMTKHDQQVQRPPSDSVL